MSDATVHDHPAAEAPPIEQLPLDAWHRAQGARMVDFAGYAMPIQYDGIMAEHLWTRAHAGLFDVSHMGQLSFAGEGVDAALEALLPGDLQALKPGKLRYSLLVSEYGGILDDLMVTRLTLQNPFASSPSTASMAGAQDELPAAPEVEKRLPGDGVSTALDTSGEGATPSLYMVVNGATKWDDLGHLREHLDDAFTINYLDDRALLALQGPEAVTALERLVPGVAELVFMSAAAFDWEGHGLWISRSGYTGEDGFEISLPADAAGAFADALVEQPEVKPIGLGARDSLRLEAGLPLYGHDLDENTTPVAADLGFALSKRRREEGGFLGAEPILAERAQGAATRRVGLVVEGRQPVREGADVVDAGGAVIGRVTSGGFAPSVGQPIAMAYVPAALASPGTRVTLSQRGKAHAAQVVALPFVPHRYVRHGGAQ